MWKKLMNEYIYWSINVSIFLGKKLKELIELQFKNKSERNSMTDLLIGWSRINYNNIPPNLYFCSRVHGSQ